MQSHKVVIDRSNFNDWFFDFYKSQNMYLLSYGGAGSGKSRAAAQKVVMRLLTEPNAKHRILVSRKVANTIRHSVYEELKTVIYSFKAQSEFQFNKSELSMTHLPTGNQIITAGLDDPEKLKSISGITSEWADELTEYEEDDFNQLDLRLRGNTPYYKQFIGTFNPIDENHWIVKRFFGEHADKYDLRIFKTTFRDNRFIDEQYQKKLENLVLSDENAYRVYMLGEWGVLKVVNAFLTSYDANKHESTQAVRQTNKRLLIILDFNMNPFAVNFAHIWRDNDGEHCHVFDEASITAGSIPAMADLIQERYGNQLHDCWITGDAMGKHGDISERDNSSYYDQLLRLLKLRPSVNLKVPNNPQHSNSRADCNYVLHYFPDLKINPQTCPNTVRDCKIVQCDAFGSIIKRDRKKVEQRADHLDNVRYLINTFLVDWIHRHRGPLKK